MGTFNPRAFPNRVWERVQDVYQNGLVNRFAPVREAVDLWLCSGDSPLCWQRRRLTIDSDQHTTTGFKTP